MNEDAPKFNLDQSVVYKGKLYKIIGAQIMGVTGWRYDISGKYGTANAVWEHELK